VGQLLNSILESWLPTKWLSLLLAATISAAVIVWNNDTALIFLQGLFEKQPKLMVQIATATSILCLGLLLVLHLVLRYYKSLFTPPKPITLKDLQFNILSLVAKYHSQELQATPIKIANDLNMKPDIILANMWQYHNEQFVTFRTGGAKPDIDTSFFLCEKAWEHMKIVKTP
jgi:hypothetical protein